MSVVYFLLLLGVLVLIHEFGHFLAAKLLDFKVQRFSLGFGRPLVRIKLGETEYQLAMFPLGGYVRILGEDDPDDVPAADARRAFVAKPMWQRLIVVFAGPVANFVLPVFIYFAFFAGHTQLPAAVVGDVLPNTPAARADLHPGDRILSANHHPIRYWEDLESVVQANVDRPIRLHIRRGDTTLDKYITPVETTIRKRGGTVAHKGRIGIAQAPSVPEIGVLDPTSPAGRAGLRTGDIVIAVDGRKIRSYGELSAALSGATRELALAYFRGERVPGLPVTLLAPHLAEVVPDIHTDAQGRRATTTGIRSAEMFVARVVPGSPADLAGLRPGDLITTLDGARVTDFDSFDQALQSRPDRSWRIGWRRARPGGSVITLSAKVRQVRRDVVDDYGNHSERLAFGASNDVAAGRGVMVPIEGRLSYAVSKAVDRTGKTIGTLAAAFWAILRGQAPRDAVGGPLMMYRAASVSGRKGWGSFSLMIALLSVSVGLLNLLPIPALDGGYLLVFAVETARRRPLSSAARDRIMLCGLVFVGIITALTLKNDIVRYIAH